jgi:uncharacterized protein (TIGR02246 family)
MKTMSLVWLCVTIFLAGCTSSPVVPGPGASENCKPTSEAEIAALFDRWNASLQTGDARRVVANYADPAILLPTQTFAVRRTRAEIEAYFVAFLRNRPSGTIDEPRFIELGCNRATDAGLYTFHFASSGTDVKARYTYTYRWNGKEWLITSHHSSVVP